MFMMFLFINNEFKFNHTEKLKLLKLILIFIQIIFYTSLLLKSKKSVDCPNQDGLEIGE